VAAVFFVALLLWCKYRGERAVLPLFLMKNRSMIGASAHAFFIWVCPRELSLPERG
jgi:hypothetical protein